MTRSERAGEGAFGHWYQPPFLVKRVLRYFGNWWSTASGVVSYSPAAFGDLAVAPAPSVAGGLVIILGVGGSVCTKVLIS
jgi:hypothetical protein